MCIGYWDTYFAVIEKDEYFVVVIFFFGTVFDIG